MLAIFLITISTYLFILLMGWGITCLVLPKNSCLYRLWLIPWFGLTLIAILSLWLSRAGLGTNLIVYILVFIAVSILVGCKVRNIRIGISLVPLDAAFAASFLFCLFLALYPLVVTEQFPTTISLGNNDSTFYAIAGDYLKNHSIAEQVPDLTDYTNYLIKITASNPGQRPSSWLLYSVISSLFSLPTYQIFTITMGVFFALTPALMSVFTWTVTGNRLATLICLIVSSLNVNLLYINYHSFGAQVLGQGVLVLCFLLFYLTELNPKNKSYLVALAISSCALFNLYTEITVFFIVPYILYFILRFFQNKSSGFHYIKRVFFTCLLTFAIEPLGILQAVGYFLVSSKQEVGWPMPRWSFPVDMIGFLNIHSSGSSALLLLATSVPIVYFIAVGINKSNNRALGVSIFLFFILVLAYLRFYRVFSYGYYKAVVFFAFSYIVYFSIGVSYFIDKFSEKFQHKYLNHVRLFFLSTTLIISLFSMLPTFSQMNNSHLSVNKKMLELAKIPLKFNDNQTMVISLDSLWENLWAGLLLQNLQNVPNKYSKSAENYIPSDYLHNNVKDSDLYLVDKSESSQIIKLSNRKQKLYWQGNYYAIMSIEENVSIRLGENWWNQEKWWGDTSDSNAFRWMNQNGAIILENNYDKSLRKTLDIKFIPYLPKTTIDIYLDDKIIQTLNVQEFKFYSVPLNLKSGSHKVRLYVREGTVGDIRPLSVGVNVIRLNDN